MYIGAAKLALRIPGAHTLKEKRGIVRPIVSRLRARGEVSVAEVGDNDLWGNAEIGLAFVSSSIVAVQNCLQRAIEQFEGSPEIEVVSVIREVYSL